MKTKRDFDEKIAAAISDYPLASQLYQVRDPRLMASLGAMSAMLAMMSEEQDVAAAEPFTKARDMTVLADGASKGVLPFGKPMQCLITVANANATPFALATGRTLQDRQGRRYVVQAGVTVPASGSATVIAHQKSERTFDHTVTISQPFYLIEVPKAAPGLSIAAVRVHDSLNNEFPYVPEFVNVAADEQCFHLLSDEQQRLYVEFGALNLAGYQPDAGEVFSITITDTEGEFTLAAGSKFAFEYTGSPAEAAVTLTLEEVLSPGAAPMTISQMREVTSYPSIYNTSAVYLGNFDFLVRRNLGPFRFLSVWNEQTEERVRGASVDNINTLFVAALKDGVSDATLRSQIREVILRADDSYKISDVEVEEIEIEVTVKVWIPAVYDFDEVSGQIRELILRDYGRDSTFAKSGQNRVLHKNVYRLLVANVPALMGERSDLDVVTADDDPGDEIKPEEFRYVSEDSLVIEVDQFL